MSSIRVTTNFKTSDGIDAGDKLITKDYLMSVYPSIAQELGKTPELWTWGYNNSGQLGINNTNNRSAPVTTFVGGTNWKQVSSGYNHTSAIKTDGTLWTWGTNGNGRLGDNTTTQKNTPVTTFAGGTNWKQVSCAKFHTSAIKTDGTLWLWGFNGNGLLGTNDTVDRSTPVTTFAGGTNWKQVSGGGQHSAAIKTDGTLWVWGRNISGTLGDNNSNIRSIPATTFAGGTNWKQVSCGGYYTTAIKTDGTLWTWGFNGTGQLGTNDLTGRSTPTTTFAGGNNWKQVSGGDSHTSAVKTDGTLWTWGSDLSGQLGRLSTSSRLFPSTTFAGGTNWSDTSTDVPEELYTLSGGNAHTLSIKTDGTLWIWGLNSSGQLGDNTTTQRNTPVTTFAGGTNWKQVSGGYSHTAAIKTDGTLWVWGQNGSGRLGTNDTTSRSTPVTTFAGGTDWKQVSGGGSHTAAVKTDGTLWTWGNGSFGQLGTNDSLNRLTPVTTFAGGTDWKQVSGGGSHTAAVKTDGTLWLWGSGSNGQLGNNSTFTRNIPVTTFAGGTNWKQVDCGSDHTSAVKTDGTLWVWGLGIDGQLGNNRTTPFTVQVPVTTFAGGTNWKQVSCGDRHTSAVKTDGTLWTWGRNTNGQLGDNTTIIKSRPVTTFAGGTNWKQVSSGYNHTVALEDDGVNKKLYVFGNNAAGQCGITLTYFLPTQIDSSTTWKQVDGGTAYTAAIKTDGTLWTWGYNGQGQLGINNTTNGLIPTTTFAGGTNWKQVSSGGHTVAIESSDFI